MIVVLHFAAGLAALVLPLVSIWALLDDQKLSPGGWLFALFATVLNLVVTALWGLGAFA